MTKVVIFGSVHQIYRKQLFMMLFRTIADLLGNTPKNIFWFMDNCNIFEGVQHTKSFLGAEIPSNQKTGHKQASRNKRLKRHTDVQMGSNVLGGFGLSSTVVFLLPF